ncbi:hypothetical protein B0I33_108374 [Prauserella shujinwangii]|uniref:Tetratricopeptide repeat protein n=1 Tax=Prauserella shujinwangii TaxID=1453103 RepID=A0A2T0LRZ1_9PSEU|nr:hypothetical protein [Prauserella shujinwangii]PRX46223.1 hypothetical protein B0I33_108374 [Prauserella shujinwangii]
MSEFGRHGAADDEESGRPRGQDRNSSGRGQPDRGGRPERRGPDHREHRGHRNGGSGARRDDRRGAPSHDRGGRSGRREDERSRDRHPGRDRKPFERRERSGDREGRPFERRERSGDREGRPFERRKRPGDREGRPFERRERSGGREGRPFERRERPGDRQGRPDRDRDDRRGHQGGRDRREQRGDRRGAPQDRTNRPDRRDERPPRRDPRPPQAAEQPQDDETAARDLLAAPELPEDIDFADLDAEARRELRTLPRDLAERVGRHLVAAGYLIDTDPEAALAHARYAKAKASRVPIVREALGLAAYHAGNWSEALSELRAMRRMARTDSHVAVIADAERALGRPERALDLAKEVDTGRLPKEVAVELRIVAAGARRDLGQLDAAVVELQGDDLHPARRDPWSARLFYAYADNLLAAGRRDEALRWFLHAAEADEEEETDAAERAAALGDE